MALTEADVMNRIIKLLEWTYDVALGAQDAQVIQAEIVRGWSDPSGKEIVAYLVRVEDTIRYAPASAKEQLRAQAVRVLEEEFKVRKAGARGRIMVSIHRVVENLRPGATRVLPPAPPAPRAEAPPKALAPLPQPYLPPTQYTAPMPPAYPPQVSFPVPLMPPMPPQGFDPSAVLLDKQREMNLELLKYKIQKMDLDTAGEIIRKG